MGSIIHSVKKQAGLIKTRGWLKGCLVNYEIVQWMF